MVVSTNIINTCEFITGRTYYLSFSDYAIIVINNINFFLSIYACRIISRQRSFLPWAISQTERYLHVNHSASGGALSLRRPSDGDHEEVVPCSIFNNSFNRQARCRRAVNVRWPPRRTRIKYNRIKSEVTRKHYVPVGSTKSRLSFSGFRRRSPISHINDAINANACRR